jgi:phage-related protein
MLAQSAKQYGLALDSLSMAKLSNLHDSIVRVKNAFFGFALELMTQAAPTLDKFATYLTETVAPRLREWLGSINVGQFLTDVAARLSTFGSFVADLFSTLQGHLAKVAEFMSPAVEKLREWGWVTNDNAAALAALGIEAGLVATVGAPLLTFIGGVMSLSAGFTKAIATMIGAAGKGGIVGLGVSCGLIVAAGGGGYLFGEWLYDLADRRFPKVRKAFDDFGAAIFDLYNRITQAMAGIARETSTWGNAVGAVVERVKAVWRTFNDLILGLIRAVVIAAQGNWPAAWNRMAAAVEMFAQRCRSAFFSIPVPPWLQQGFGGLQNWLGTPGWRAPNPGAWSAPSNASGSSSGSGAPAGNVTVHVNGTAGESPEAFARRVARAVVDAQRMKVTSSGALLAMG